MRKLSFGSAFLVLLSVLGCALVPGVIMLAYYQHVIYTFPLEWTYPDTAFYMFKAIASTIMMFAAVVLYSDISFPFVMYCFGKIFARIDLKTDKI